MKTNDILETQQGSPFNSPRFHENQVLARFNPALPRNIQARLLTEQVITTLSDPNCFIGQNYHRQNWGQIFVFIHQSHCRRFFVMQTGVPQIIEQISKIRFTHLKQIDLSSNKITNVETISFLKIPHIKSLVLKSNFISNINALRRGKWKNLQILDIEGNLVIQWKRIAEIYINKEQIDYFAIEFMNRRNLGDVEDIAKLYSKVAWNSRSEKIENQIDLFGGVEGRLKQNQSESIIRMRQRRYKALKEKFH